MKVSVFVLYYKDDSFSQTLDCIKSLKKSSHQDVELICVNNGLKSGFDKAINKIWPSAKHVKLNQNTGFTGGNIAALKQSTGDVVCLLNNDAIIHQDAMKEAVDIFLLEPEVGVVGGKIFTLSDNHPPLRESNPFHSYQKFNPFNGDAVSLDFDPVEANVDNVSGSMFFIRRSVIDKIGFLDDKFFAYYEESDFSARAILAGYKVRYSNKIKLWHQNGSLNPDPKHQRFFYFQLFRNQFIFAANNFSGSAFRNYLKVYISRVFNRSSLSVSMKNNLSPERYFYQSVKSIFFSLPSILNSRMKKRLSSKPKLEQQLLNNIQDLSLVIDSKKPITELIESIKKEIKNKLQEVFIIQNQQPTEAELKEITKLNNQKGYRFAKLINSELFNLHQKAVVEANSNNICFVKDIPKQLDAYILAAQKNPKLKFILNNEARPNLIFGSKNNWLEYFAMHQIKDIKTHLNDISYKEKLNLNIKASGTKLKFNNQKMSLQLEPTDFPVFINCRDRLDPLKELLAWLKQEGVSNSRIVLIDNNSSNPELLKLFDSKKYEVIKLNKNVGHISFWQRNIINLIDEKQRFIYTDPDIVPSDGSHGALLKFNQLLDKYPDIKKVGFGLSLDAIPESYHLKKDVIKWEKKFWEDEIEPEVFRAPIDTTFALYRASTPYLHEPALRTGGDFVAEHEPWHTNSKKPSADSIYYLERADRASNSWGSGKKDGVAHHQKVSKH